MKVNKNDVLFVGFKKGGVGRGKKEISRYVIEIATPMKSLPVVFADFVSSNIKTITKHSIQVFTEK